MKLKSCSSWMNNEGHKEKARPSLLKMSSVLEFNK